MLERDIDGRGASSSWKKASVASLGEVNNNTNPTPCLANTDKWTGLWDLLSTMVSIFGVIFRRRA